jgi:DNA-binding MarR family transcriptional regulator
MAKDDELPFAVTPKVKDACMCLHLQRAARAVARRFDDAFRPLDLTNGQFTLLMSLNAPTPPSIGAVSAVLAMDRTTLTANLKPLERRGLVKVIVDPADRRSRLMVLTLAGRRLVAKALPLWKRTQAATERLVAESGADRVRADLLALS